MDLPPIGGNSYANFVGGNKRVIKAPLPDLIHNFHPYDEIVQAIEEDPDAVHKQGVAGVFCVLLLLVLVTFYYKKKRFRKGFNICILHSPPLRCHFVLIIFRCLCKQLHRNTMSTYHGESTEAIMHGNVIVNRPTDSTCIQIMLNI